MQLTEAAAWRAVFSSRSVAALTVCFVLSRAFGAAAAKRAEAKTRAGDEETEEDAEDEGDVDVRKEAHSGVTARASTAFSAYSDSDAVHVLSPTVAGTVGDEIEGWSVSGRYLVDAVSAASVDVVSAASAHWFEIRHVGSLAADIRSGSVGATIGGGVSREPDYLSIGTGITMSIELLEKNLTPFVGISYGHDDIGRTGMPKDYWRTMQKGGLQLGATFVVSRSTIASLSADLIAERGYLAKPYRYVPLFAPGAGPRVPAGASVDLVNQLRIDQRPADALPEARDRYAVSGRIAHRLDASTLRFDQRLYRDSWGLMASTSDARFTLDLGSRVALWPHVRYHTQKGIGIWQRAYEATMVSGTLAIPRYRTGDRELGPLTTLTAGGGLKVQLGRDPRSPTALTLQLESLFTRFDDALYIKNRRALYANVLMDVAFE